MHKSIFKIALLALGWSQLTAAAYAVAVPQRSAADYIFTRPVLTNHIRGVVVDVTNAYGVIRSEDVDWLKEAICERLSIRSGHAATEWYVVGPVVGKRDIPYSDENDFWNGFPRGSDAGWLDPDTPLLDGIRLYNYGAQPVTNVYVVKRLLVDGHLTNSFSVIEMPMTNGTTSVYTNRWRAYLSPVEDVIFTNIHEWTELDYCQAHDAGIFCGLTNNTYFRSGLYLLSRETPSISVLSNMFECLRGTKRLADVDSLITNSVPYIHELENDIGGQTYHTGTNGYMGSVSVYFHAENYWSERTWCPAFTADVETRFKSSLLTTGGTSRASVEAVYANCEFRYLGTSNNMSTNAVVRLQSPSLDVSGENALCRVQIDTSAIFAACASAAGIPTPPSTIEYRAAEDESEFWEFEIRGITIIYRITPSVKLPDW